MTLMPRRVRWPPDNIFPRSENYVIVADGKKVCRLYRTKLPTGVRWLWTVYGSSASGTEDTRELAQAVFKAGWERPT
jgi:hypothetical protein